MAVWLVVSRSDGVGGCSKKLDSGTCFGVFTFGFFLGCFGGLPTFFLEILLS